MAVLTVAGVRSDPVLSHNFLISLLDTDTSGGAGAIAKTAVLSLVSEALVGGFTECTGLEMSLDLEDYEEGGRNGEVLRFPTRVKWSNLILKTGMTSGLALWDWFYGFVQGRGKRRSGLIVLTDDLHQPHNIWWFWRGLPVRYTGPSLNAGQSAVAVESIEIAHEGLYQVPYVAAAATGVQAGIGLGLKHGR
jgi:phage tail-like protein